MYVLVLFASKNGGTAQIAQHVCYGIEQENIEARLRTVSTDLDYPVANMDDLKNCHGLAMGSPSHFGLINSELKSYLEKTTELWFNGELSSKPAIVFGTSSTIHGGQEALLLSMMIPLLHHGMLLIGTPYTFSALTATKTGGTPYGPTAVINQDKTTLDKNEISLAKKTGQRLAKTVIQLNSPS